MVLIGSFRKEGAFRCPDGAHLPRTHRGIMQQVFRNARLSLGLHRQQLPRQSPARRHKAHRRCPLVVTSEYLVVTTIAPPVFASGCSQRVLLKGLNSVTVMIRHRLLCWRSFQRKITHQITYATSPLTCTARYRSEWIWSYKLTDYENQNQTVCI